jgi:hypothetical protein
LQRYVNGCWKHKFETYVWLTESYNIIEKITITCLLLKQFTLFTVIWDLVNLGQFDHINQLVLTLSVITLSGFHCSELIFLYLGKLIILVILTQMSLLVLQL